MNGERTQFMSDKKYKVGMVLGKFYPPHIGHLNLINTAAEQCDKLYVLCCSLKSEKILGINRFASLLKIYKGNSNIIIKHVTDENPQHPEEGKKKEFYDIWYNTVYDNVPEFINAVFTSEDYGDEFAESLGCEHVLVDKDRIRFPISGTMVRENPMKYWDWIPDEVKGLFSKKVVVLGVESSGKTTLVENLHKFFSGRKVLEFGRTYTEQMDDLNKLEIRDFEIIAFNHMLSINDDILVKNPDKLIFVDTEAITTKVFGKLYLGDNFVSKTIENIIDSQKFDLWFLMDLGVPYVQDGNRLPESIREIHFNLIKEELGKRKIPYILLSGSFEERFESAKNYIFNLIK